MSTRGRPSRRWRPSWSATAARRKKKSRTMLDDAQDKAKQIEEDGEGRAFQELQNAREQIKVETEKPEDRLRDGKSSAANSRPKR